MTSKKNIIIGCMSWGQWGKQLSSKTQTEMIEFCVEQNNTTFDHADIYGDYTTEHEFGIALRASTINREDIQLITKCGIQYDGKTRTNSIKHYNYSKEYIIWSAEQSLKNLQTSYIDTFLLHRPSPLMHPDEIAEAINHLQKSGKIINFGVSNFTPAQVQMIQSRIPITTNQIEFSLTQHQAMYDGTLDQMIEKNIQPMSWSSLGTYFKEDSEKNKRIKECIQNLTDKYNISEEALLLAWILSHPANITPIIGTTNKDRIIQSNKALSCILELEDWFKLLAASQGHRVP